MAQSCMYSLCSGGGAQPIEPKSSGRTFEKLCDIQKYAHPDFLAEAQCNLRSSNDHFEA